MAMVPRKLSNYAITLVNGTLSITADNKSRSVGTPNPPLTGSIAGIKNNDSVSAPVTTIAGTNSPVGGYPSAPSALGLATDLNNYAVSLVNGTLNVASVSAGPAVSTTLTSATPLAVQRDSVIATTAQSAASLLSQAGGSQANDLLGSGTLGPNVEMSVAVAAEAGLPAGTSPAIPVTPAAAASFPKISTVASVKDSRAKAILSPALVDLALQAIYPKEKT
jgi:hypothetical protein